MYYIGDGGFDDAGRKLIKVSAFGRTNAFANVARIDASFFGGGNDQLFIDSTVAVPVTINMGDNDDVVVYGGTNSTTTINGGTGDDYIAFTGTTADGLLVKIDGGNESTDDGPDNILGNADDISHGDFIDVSLSSGANIDAGDGDDYVAGSRFADLIFGGAGGDEIAGNGGADQLDGGTGQDKLVLTFAGLGSRVSGGGGADYLVLSGTNEAETVDFEATATTFTDDRQHDLTQVSHLYTFKVAPATSDPAIYVRDVENVVFFAGNGTDLMRVNDMRNSNVDVLELDLGGNDFAPDRVVVQGSSGNDDFKLNTDTPNVNTRTYDKLRTTAKISGSSSTTYSLIVGGTNRDHGDVLRFETGDGNDIVDASALGGEQTISTGVPAVQTTVHSSDLIALQIVTGNGDDRLIGSPWNDLLDGGRGSDRYTGGDGLDTFFKPTIDHQSNQTANLITGQHVLLVGASIGGTPGTIYEYSGPTAHRL